MSTESLNHLSDVELHRKLLQHGFPSTPVTETTRPILIRKLKKHVKNEKLKKRKSSNYVVYSNDMHNRNTSSAWDQPSFPMKQSVYGNVLENNNGLRNYNKNLDNSEELGPTILTTRMYAPPPVVASDYDSDGDPINSASKYRNICPIPCPIDTSNSYAKPNSITSSSDGGVVNRLLSFRDTTIQRKFNPRGPYTVHVSKNHTRTDSVTARRLGMSDLRDFFKKPELNQYTIPQVLIAALLIFLAIIIVLYISKKSDQNLLDQTVVKYKLCGPNDVDVPLVSDQIMCIGSDMLKSALQITEALFKFLNERARQHHCLNGNLSPVIEMSEFIMQLSGESRTHIPSLQSKLIAAKYLITQNPQWMIKIIKPSDTTVEQIPSSLSYLSFEMMQPNLPLRCIISKKLARFFTIIGSIIVILGSCLAIYYAVSTYRKIKKERLFAAEKLSREIISELIYSSSQSENSEVTINQLQEKLLPQGKRSKYLHTWNRAVKIIEETENHVLFGMVIRNGEKLRTMAWNGNVDNREIGVTKKWHSPAFDNTNKITKPPTSCLKIRHMIEPAEVDNPNLKQQIVDAIFEKVGSRCKICDIQLDTQSCCVYLRCGSEADAGIVHSEINGWWFDKRLISIKFLRLERYLSRFPKSNTEPTYFPPSDIATHNRS
ncbi:inner nuclear membrane protein Man1 [Scaptodrosophila lebanonensis]|uniref:Inner nuclear membrane protein Man1 n=1 Tax=Drosophila lebanonensis TaxID=7225 RepID=A0A6J2TVN7_DROLE|nr:inner nuclear membrane protein Man1 [Scaptodrosophila lebanonensis]XP_030380616.1 inner nuclear membrane protein Man1 [Scaptodrosophila lebanonensis]XP_030380625.1 inner nuclear membrane protein Man1 [Scaptodrosophila lebanonensis]